MYKGICTELGCICNETESEDSVFGQTCASDSSDYPGGELTNLGDTFGFSKPSTDFSWTVASEIDALMILIFMSVMCLGITYKLLEDTKEV